jgi:hypothetical protein
MDNFSLLLLATFEQTEADEEILTYTVSDEALEAAAGQGGRGLPFSVYDTTHC